MYSIMYSSYFWFALKKNKENKNDLFIFQWKSSWSDLWSTNWKSAYDESYDSNVNITKASFPIKSPVTIDSDFCTD